MMKLFQKVESTLKKDKRLMTDKGELLKNRIIELTLKLDRDLINLLLNEKELREHFFATSDKVLIFDQNKFIKFIDNKNFLPDSYTTFKNKIGLTGDERYLAECEEIVLSWPFKDCILEGGITKEDEKRDEIFYNEILAPDEVDRLKGPKVFTNFKMVDVKGEHAVDTLNQKDNLLIRGNNLLGLHSLRKKFPGKIKLIYIDPPYNIGGGDFGYNDNFNHSTWLTFMKNRLEIAKELLSKDGAIFVQIDYHEIGYLNVLMDEIFGKQNFIQMITVKAASPAGFKTVNPGPVSVSEYILFYTRSRESFNFIKNYVPCQYNVNYNLVISNKQDEPKKWKLIPIRDAVLAEVGLTSTTPKILERKFGKFWRVILDNLIAEYALKNSEIVVSIRDPHKPTEKLKQLLEESKSKRDQILVYEKGQNGGEDGDRLQGYVINGGALAFYSNKVMKIDGERTPTELLTDFWNDISWAGIAREGGVKLKNGKKPEKLLKRILEICTEPGDIVLDFFLGSGTTNAVAHKMGRQYIGIEQLDYSDNDSFIRLNNVIHGDESGISKLVNWKGGGSFVYCELMTCNEKYVEQIKRAKTTDDPLKIWKFLIEKAFLSYKVNPKAFDENADDFKKLTLQNQKKFLIECLDKNQLYVNLSEIDDKDYDVSTRDKELNRKFYGGL